MIETMLITGTTSGVGLSIANHFAGRFRVIAVGRDPVKLDGLFRGNPNVTTCRMDLSEIEEVNGVTDAVVKQYGTISYLINNAGVNIKGDCEAISPRQFFLSQQVNALSPLIILQKLMPGMKKRNFGRVIHITSGAPLNCFPGYCSYSASKAALNALTVTAARECCNHNIKINLMSPGPVFSNMAPKASMDPSICHPTADYLMSLGQDGPTGRFFWLGYEIPLFPDLTGVQWLEGKADERFKKVF